jgi:hypothetical protein
MVIRFSVLKQLKFQLQKAFKYPSLASAKVSAAESML